MTKEHEWFEAALGEVSVIQQGKRVDHLAVGEGVAPVEGATGVIGSWTEGTYDFEVVGIGCRGSVGQSRLIPEGHWLGNNVMGLYPRDQTQLLTQFLVLALSTINLDAAGAISGQVQKQITRTSLAPVPIEVPPLAVQRRIVDLVGAVDTHITNVRTEAGVARSLSVAVLDECVERALASGSLVPIENLLEAKVTYGVLKPGDPDPQGIQLIRGQDIRDGGIVAEQVRTISPALDNEYARSRVQGGDIVLILVGTPGEAALVPDHMSGANISRAVGRLRFLDGVAPDYMLGVLRSPWGQRLLHEQVRGAVQQMINLKELRVLEVPVPDIALQRELAEIMSSATAHPVALDSEVSRLIAFRSRLLQSLLSREVEIPETYDKLLAGVA